MADDTDQTIQNSNDINDDDTEDDNLLDDVLLDTERDVTNEPEGNELVLAEKEAIADEEFDEPLAVKTDPGVVNETTLPAELWEEGAGANEAEGEAEGDTFGMHVEEFADESEDDDDNPFTV